MGYFLSSLFLLINTTSAYEVDDFYCNQKLARVTASQQQKLQKKLNKFTSQKIKDAVTSANDKILKEIKRGKINHTTCRDWGTMKNYLFERINGRLGEGVVTPLEDFIADEFPQYSCQIDKEDSIYNGYSGGIFALLDIINNVSTISSIGESIKMCNVVFGSDKLGHFFGDGLQSVTYARQEGGYFDERKSVMRNIRQEEGQVGKESTGVLSFGDVTANLHGADFYANILYGTRNQNGQQPHVLCTQQVKIINGKKRKVPQYVMNPKRPFDWCEFVHPGWDESINCSEYIPEVKKVVEKNMKDKGYTCPRDVHLCKKAEDQISQYFSKRVAKRIFKQKCSGNVGVQPSGKSMRKAR